jgi:hypothetical protein
MQRIPNARLVAIKAAPTFIPNEWHVANGTDHTLTQRVSCVERIIRAIFTPNGWRMVMPMVRDCIPNACDVARRARMRN